MDEDKLQAVLNAVIKLDVHDWEFSFSESRNRCLYYCGGTIHYSEDYENVWVDHKPSCPVTKIRQAMIDVGLPPGANNDE